MKLINKDALTEKLRERRIKHRDFGGSPHSEYGHEDDEILSLINSLEVKEVDISNISENLAEAEEYLDYTYTSNLAHNKPIVSARLKRAIRCLFDAGLFELTHDKKYRMEKLGLKAQKGE